MFFVYCCCFVFFVNYLFLLTYVMYSPISFRVTSLALGQSYCPSVSEVTLKNLGKIDCFQTKIYLYCWKKECENSVKYMYINSIQTFFWGLKFFAISNGNHFTVYIISWNAKQDCKCFINKIWKLIRRIIKINVVFCHWQGMTLSRYECHVCEKKFSRGAKLTAHLKKKHNFKWPSGHRRFR